MRFLYSTVMSLLTPFLLLRLWWKGRRSPGYRERIGERLSLRFSPTSPVDVWVHAVSLGEVIAVTVLVEALLAKNLSVLITTMTPTGSERVQGYFGSKVLHQYLPYDLPWTVNRFLQHYRPRVGLLMETELWPNLIACTRKKNIPLLLINGRLSAKSLQGYVKAKRLFSPILKKLKGIYVQTDEDKKRFIQLGANLNQVQVLGNLKFNAQFEVKNPQLLESLKQKWGPTRRIFVLASTHENEESLFLSSLRILQKALPQVLLLIAPRHPERFEQIFKLAESMGFRTGRRTQLETITSDKEVIIMDSLGELMAIYACSHYAFVGGSLVPVGGHNVLEPLGLGIPVFSGPHVFNFKAICESLVEAQAIRIVQKCG